MDQPLCKLTLVYPPASEAHIVEMMLNAEPPLQGFTTFETEGHGHSFSNATMRERVRGRIARGMLVVVLPRARVPSLLDEIRVKAAIADLVYWVEPVDAFGRLAPAVAHSKSDLVTE
ncbi:DUF3240 family protein [Hyphomicrobium sp. D-2]|uniref:DUF3240 family protein n=1 Tax=Hyphomicrobium sp. D-2 TaxID=3041621 RepID=UPI002453B326|nr:DUF3240 family protein [Hyphomicrobium sp. D-2]MDH4982401.1 DUF3240 family protein [Hyphomicrobium sp. D-2]